MAQLNISVPDGLRDWIDSRVADGRYASPSDYLRDLVRRDQDDEEQLARLRAAIDVGLRSGVSNRSVQDIIRDHMSKPDAA